MRAIWLARTADAASSGTRLVSTSLAKRWAFGAIVADVHLSGLSRTASASVQRWRHGTTLLRICPLAGTDLFQVAGADTA